MYKHVAYKEVSKNFTAHFGISISPYFDRQGSNESGNLVFIAHKFVKYLIQNWGYEGNAHEPLCQFIDRKYGKRAWKFLNKLMR